MAGVSVVHTVTHLLGALLDSLDPKDIMLERVGTHIHAHTHTHTHTHTISLTHVHTCTYTRTHIHRHRHPVSHSHRHTHTHTHIHTHTQVEKLLVFSIMSAFGSSFRQRWLGLGFRVREG